MTDEVQTDAKTALADVKSVIASLPAETAKVKVFWQDYRAYLVCLAFLILGAYLGHKF